jgi:hypothetical protein
VREDATCAYITEVIYRAPSGVDSGAHFVTTLLGFHVHRERGSQSSEILFVVQKNVGTSAYLVVSNYLPILNLRNIFLPRRPNR